MKNRECPHCHKKVSIRNCIKYILRGTNYSTTCNHCGRKLWLVKEPIPFMYCVFAGFLMMYLPMQYFLYYCEMDFLHSMLYCLPLAFITEVVCSILILCIIYFKKKKKGILPNNLTLNYNIKKLSKKKLSVRVPY